MPQKVPQKVAQKGHLYFLLSLSRLSFTKSWVKRTGVTCTLTTLQQQMDRLLTSGCEPPSFSYGTGQSLGFLFASTVVGPQGILCFHLDGWHRTVGKSEACINNYSFFFLSPHEMKEEIETTHFEHTFCSSRDEPRCRAAPPPKRSRCVRFTTTSPMGFIV